jgi:hypothetical protein
MHGEIPPIPETAKAAAASRVSQDVRNAFAEKSGGVFLVDMLKAVAAGEARDVRLDRASRLGAALAADACAIPLMDLARRVVGARMPDEEARGRVAWLIGRMVAEKGAAFVFTEALGRLPNEPRQRAR